MTIKRSNRGASIDFDALMAKAADSTAVGNMRVNAQGDVIGKGGEIVQRNEDRVRAYYKNNPRSSTSASLKGDTPTQKLQPDTPISNAPKTAATAKENVRTAMPQAQAMPTSFRITPPNYNVIEALGIYTHPYNNNNNNLIP